MKLPKGMRSIILKLRAKVKPWRATEKNEVRKAMNSANGDKLLAASLLGIGKTTLYRKLKKFGSLR